MKFSFRGKTFFGYGLRFFSLSLVLALALSLICSVVVEAQDDYYEKDFEWDYKDRHWTWSLSIPKSLYNNYKSVSVSLKTRNGIAGYGFLTTTDDDFLKIVADKLQDAASDKGYNTYDTVSFALAFVQSLLYTSDSETSGYDEYPRFPLETLVDDGGDCEDTSILFATLTLIMNYSTVYINPPDHVAVGVWGKDLPGTYYTYNDKNYYYCETTGEGFEIGETPIAYRNQKAYIFDIRYFEQYDPKTGITLFDINFNSFGLIISILVVVSIGYIVLRSTSTKKEEIQIPLQASD